MYQLSVCFIALALTLATMEARLFFSTSGCPGTWPVRNFSIDQFMGVWYQYGSFENQFLTWCTKYTFTLHPHGQLIDVKKESATLFIKSSIKGQMKLADPSRNESKFTINWIEDVFEGRENDVTPVNYRVVATDYTSYAVIYNCVYIIGSVIFKIEGYVYTRNRDASGFWPSSIKDQLDFRLVDADDLFPTVQRPCYN